MGGAFSRTDNLLSSITKSQVTTTMKSEVDASVNLACSNVQEVVNSKGCNVNFAKQSCQAYGFADVATSTTLDNSTTQAIVQDLKQKAETSNKGITFGVQSSNSSNIMKLYTSMGVETLQSFKTDCSKNISSLNLQSVRNTTCTEQNEINFAAQDISAEVIGECVATQVGKSSSAQELTQILDQTATAKNEGITTMGLFAGVFLVLAFVLGIPLGLKILTMRSKAQRPPETRAASFLAVVLVLALVFWFPGVGSYYLGIGFWPYPGDADANALCNRGKPIAPETVVNTFMWYDDTCASNPNNTCTPERKMIHYKACGVFSGICDDPALADDKASFINVSEACAAVEATRPSSLQTCQPADIASGIFSNFT